MIDCSSIRIYIQNSCFAAQAVDKVGNVIIVVISVAIKVAISVAIKVAIKVVISNCCLTYVATPGDNIEVIDFITATRLPFFRPCACNHDATRADN